MARGKLITIEGVDGAGKSTLAAGLVDALKAWGLRVELLREPGGVALSERIRTLVADPALAPSAAAEALLYAAARAQLVAERLTPLLESGRTVVLDRFVDSSLAYQGVGRGLGLEAVAAINALATGGLTPDRTLLLQIAPATGLARQEHRGQAQDRMELEDAEFFATVANAYSELAHSEPQRIRRLDAERPTEEVLAAALAALEDLLKRTPTGGPMEPRNASPGVSACIGSE